MEGATTLVRCDPSQADEVRPNAILHSTRLPNFTFIDQAGGETVLRLSAATGEIRAKADHLAVRIAGGSIVGLMYPSTSELIVNWMACVLAGMRPLVMQYPTKKQSRTYWTDSVRDTIRVSGIGALICDDYCAELVRDIVLLVPQAELDTLSDWPSIPFDVDSFSIIQLSSGTTGFRKAIEFTGDQLLRHVLDYNETLQLTAGDKVVSWLPLYHDMGYVACFVMPLILGVDVVMMDPMTWVRSPTLLYDAIERHTGTICYMPNFGFEVMTRLGERRLPSMRWWVSCSEPVSALTARKFLHMTGAAETTFAPCYAMAENIFAVSLRGGLTTRAIDQADVVSCGPPIKNVETKIVDDQLWVRSPTSLDAYIGGDDIRDAEGFYPTGDLVQIVDGELYVTGRKHDLLIQAGRKYMLSDIDLTLNALFPWVKGRATAVQVYDERLGTQKPVALIETMDFCLRSDQGAMAEALKSAIGLDQIEVNFVPPRFLTKTSSGKFNRKKSAADWLSARRAREERRESNVDPIAELRASFEHVDWNQPVEEILDSLSLEVLRIILTGTPVVYQGDMSLAAIAEALKPNESVQPNVATEVIRIVSLADRNIFAALTEAEIDRLSTELGAPVVFEHMCLPPSPILLSDIIFHDYFQPRMDQAKFAAVNRAFATLRSASLILVDDVAEMYFASTQVYGALSHNLERDPTTDLILVRWPRYPQFHDELPLTMVAGCDLALHDRTQIVETLSAYLRTPIFKIATVKGFAKQTEGWDYRPLGGLGGGKAVQTLEPDDFVNALLRWIKQLQDPLKVYPAIGPSKLQISEPAHFCSHLARKPDVDRIIAKFDNFCLVGQRSSIPYLRKELDRLGKKYVYSMSYAPEVLGKVPQTYECVLICGALGEFEIQGPTVAVMAAGKQSRTHNIDDQEIVDSRFTYGRFGVPQTRDDWYYPHSLDRAANEPVVEAVWKEGMAEGARQRAIIQEQRRQRRERLSNRKAPRPGEVSPNELLTKTGGKRISPAHRREIGIENQEKTEFRALRSEMKILTETIKASLKERAILKDRAQRLLANLVKQDTTTEA